MTDIGLRSQERVSRGTTFTPHLPMVITAPISSRTRRGTPLVVPAIRGHIRGTSKLSAPYIGGTLPAVDNGLGVETSFREKGNE